MRVAQNKSSTSIPNIAITKSRSNIWIILGLACILLGAGVVIGAFWFVNKRRSEVKPPQPSTPITTIDTTETTTDNSQQQINLVTMRREELIKLLPSYALVRLKSESGESQPDDLKVIIEGENQYLVMLGTRASNDKRERMLSVFKLGWWVPLWPSFSFRASTRSCCGS